MKKIFAFVFSVLLLAGCADKATTLTILHTNDTHSQVEPNGSGRGGYARRMGLVSKAREQDPNLLLVDAGDFSQGTPYFNFYHGRVEIDALNRMGYDAVTLGNHEFDYGLDTLAMILQQANFPIVCANHDVKGTPLERVVKPYTIVHKGGLKVGIFGLGVQPKGLIADKNFEPIVYNPPYPIAQELATMLRNEKKCDVVVCLSHLGTYPATEQDYCDVELAAETRDIDVIIGGHTHKVYDDLRIRNIDGIEVPVVQMGKSGTNVGKIVLTLQERE